jgi:Tol biopolymer transport system component
VPRAFSHVVDRCLAKDPDERWQSAADVAGELRWIAATRDQAPTAATAKSGIAWERFAWIAVTITLLAATSMLLRRPADGAAASGPAPVAFSIHPPEGGTFGSPLASVPTPQFAVSPDGRQIAYVAAETDGIARLWLRPLDAEEGRPLAGTEDAAYPFWSPDSGTVAFFAQRALKRIDVAGGPPQAISEATINMRGGAWSSSGAIVFNPDTEVGLLRVSSSGGTTVPLLLGGKSWSGVARWPHFIDDKHFLIQLRDEAGTGAERNIYVGSIAAAAITKLVASDWSAQASQGFLLFLNGTTLMAQPFASDGISLTGDAVPLRSDVAGSTTGYGAFSASVTGVLAYAKPERRLGELRWFDRTGTPREVAAPAADYPDFRLSADGTRLAYSRVDPLTQAPDIWVLDLRRGAIQRMTSHPLTEASVLWSPAGDRLLHRSNRGSSNVQLFVAAGDGVTEPELVVSGAMMRSAQHSNAIPSDWSSDGAWVAYSATTTRTGFDVWAFPIGADRKPVLVARSPFNEMQGVMSPDSRWIAYASDESGRYEVYVQAFPAGKERWTISNNGGSQPRWSRQGRELMYLQPDGTLMSATTQVGQTFSASAPAALFKTVLPTAVNPYRWGYVPSADGERILIAQPVEGSVKPAITVVTNWQALLKR